YHVLARRSDGAVVAWGDDSYNQSRVPILPAGLSYVDIAADGDSSFAKRSDGAILAWGWNFWGEQYLPDLPSGLGYVGLLPDGFGLFDGCPTCELPFCLGDAGNRSVPCPCENNGASGHGCDNSASTGGAKLTVQGEVLPDRIVLSA